MEEIITLNSKIISIGMATIVWLTTSGGVTIAATISTITTAYLRYFRKNVGVTNPSFVRK